MAEKQSKRLRVAETVFDRDHLAHYTMDDPELEREIVSLFLAQLPSILDSLLKASSRDDWRFATHTLKGSAFAIGACKIGAIAKKLEAIQNFENSERRQKLYRGLLRAVDEFNTVSRSLYA